LKNFTVLQGGAYPYLNLDEKTFLGQCQIDTYAASGPGGQKRNRTYSAIRITHRTTGLSTIAEESRSQNENKARALRRLKKVIALHVRQETPDFPFTVHEAVVQFFQSNVPLRINKKNPSYPLFCAVVLDALYISKGRISVAAKKMNTSTGKLNKVLSSDKDLMVAANRLRQHFSLKPLKTT
jgi:hypothetical protein